jgi:hypothetical protein
MLSAMVWTGLRTLPFATLRRVLEKCWVRGSEATAVPTLRIVWAVHAASRRLPGGRTCLVEALAADVMLRRRGYAPVLHLGVRKRNDREELLDGHAWVVCDNRVVVGAVDRNRRRRPDDGYALIARISHTSARSSQARP